MIKKEMKKQKVDFRLTLNYRKIRYRKTICNFQRTVLPSILSIQKDVWKTMQNSEISCKKRKP